MSSPNGSTCALAGDLEPYMDDNDETRDMSNPSAPMYERGTDLKLIIGSVSPSVANLSVVFYDSRNITYGCVSHNYQVQIVNWDSKMENVHWETVQISYANTEKPVGIIQVGLVQPNARSLPLLVVCTTHGVQIFDCRNLRMLIRLPIDHSPEGEDPPAPNDYYAFCRGITCNENVILAGTSHGDILHFVCSGETSITVKKNLQEHKSPIMAMATCKYDEVTVTADATGKLIIWQKPVKGVQLKVETGHAITALEVLRKQIIIGTMRGKVVLYSLITGVISAEVTAHARPVTSLAVAPESAYILTAGEDGVFNVFKLHTRKPHAFQVEHRFSDEMEDCAIMGAQFTNGRGNTIAIGCYDKNFLAIYRIMKKPVTQV